MGARISDKKIQEIQELSLQGLSVRSISLQLDTTEETVRRYEVRAETYVQPPRISDSSRFAQLHAQFTGQFTVDQAAAAVFNNDRDKASWWLARQYRSGKLKRLGRGLYKLKGA